MIVVRVELHSAITHKVSEIARFDIWNTGEQTNSRRGDYGCASFRGRDREALAKRTVSHKGEVKNHARLHEHVLVLVTKALKSMGYDK